MTSATPSKSRTDNSGAKEEESQAFLSDSAIQGERKGGIVDSSADANSEYGGGSGADGGGANVRTPQELGATSSGSLGAGEGGREMDDGGGEGGDRGVHDG